MPQIKESFVELISHFKTNNIEPLDGIYQFEILNSKIERISLKCQNNEVEIYDHFLDPALGHLCTQNDFLLGIFNGTIDPMARMGANQFGYVRESGRPSKQFDVNEVRLLTLLFQVFNSHHVGLKFRDHLLGSFYRTGRFINPEGQVMLPGAWPVTAAIGEILFNIATIPEIKRTLEIGFAYGVSAMFICEAHREKGAGLHTAIDPWQRNYFQNTGLHNIKISRLSDYFEFMFEPDWRSLPALLERNEKFDLIFIDGLHLFDVVMLDFFYADLLLLPGGFLIVDDISFPGVAPAIDYILRHRAYEEIDRKFDRLLVLKKIHNDDRTNETVINR